MSASRLARTAVALAVLSVSGASAAATTQDQLLAELRRLAERVEKLEKRNAELEESLASDRISEREPELATRLKALETLAESANKRSGVLDAFEGITVDASVVGVAQRINSGARTDNDDRTRLNWRGDVEVGLPGGDIGRASGQFFAHVRLGQGESFGNLPPTFTGAINSTAFQLGGNAADSTALLAQAWYQLDVPVGDGETQHAEFTVGKIDPFVFFDQNEIADDESSRFLNNVFVHNPLLDSGGGAGVDDYGFTPGARLAYYGDLDNGDSWGLSLGVFGAGDASTFGTPWKSFTIGQLEYGAKLFGGLAGTYRVYAWRNAAFEGYDGSTGTNSGWGLSVDQRVTEDLTLFGRYGHGNAGKVAFDRALTVGGELTGNAWGRGADGLGFAYGWLRTSSDFGNDSLTVDGDGDAAPDFGYRASGAERVAELYYRYHVNDHLALTPDLQHIRRAGGDGDAKHITAVGLRALYAF